MSDRVERKNVNLKSYLFLNFRNSTKNLVNFHILFSKKSKHDK